MANSQSAQHTPGQKAGLLGSRLRTIMKAINDLEAKTGHGGWYAEQIQEMCNAIARDAGLKSHREGFAAIAKVTGGEA
jgi:hypothetical protein